ncbi:MAG: TonB-dependent receptor [Desulfocapsa sp.]|jgi:vitamin B12 transporter|nr:TonB-dependent receptor [Desulfocapsa sp.]MBU4029962.1 TonB-dependent receptor [Pseudomonadota bacterium]MBU4234973.1 TonB-dependent receptor [Pseudomonadota bacterium]
MLIANCPLDQGKFANHPQYDVLAFPPLKRRKSKTMPPAKQPCFAHSLAPLAATLLCCLPVAQAAQAADADPLAMYFDDSQMVEVATRAAKPLTQVAENVTIISAAEIAAMHAHSVAEVLKYTAGLLVIPEGEDIGAPSSLYIHNSDYEQVTVLLNGMRWSFIDSEYNETNAIPVAIIDRIEVIKGATSSTWGSALGGVINIVTKGTGKSILPTGSLSATHGEHNTSTYNGEAAGKMGRFGYFLHAGSLNTDGLVNDDYGRSRDFETFFGKFSAADLPFRSTLTASVGRFAPDYMKMSQLYWGEKFWTSEKDTFYTLALDSSPRESLSYHLSVQNFDREYDHPWNQRSHSLTSVMGHINWRAGDNNVVFGSEHHRNYYEDAGDPNRVYDEFLGVYVNDTVVWGKFAITPGLRYDQNLNADDLLSPSLGMTYRLSEQNLLRAGASSGFRRPPSSTLAYSPGLKPSKAWTTQLGLESTSVPNLQTKVTLFQHRERDSWTWDSTLPSDWGGQYVNTGKAVRQGFELEAETIKWHDLSLLANHTYTHTDYKDSIADWNGNIFENDAEQMSNLICKYDSPFIQARLGGHYIWLDQRHEPDDSGDYSTIIWDLTVTKPLVFRELTYDLFFVAHNLFDGSQYNVELEKNAGRWLELGITLHF